MVHAAHESELRALSTTVARPDESCTRRHRSATHASAKGFITWSTSPTRALHDADDRSSMCDGLVVHVDVAP